MKNIKVLEVASKEIGTVESPAGTNKTKYGEWFGFNGVAWCAIFVSWVFDKAGVPLGNIGFLKGMAGCGVAVAHYRKTKEVTTEPKPGDIVFFDWNMDNQFDHVGIFVKWIAPGVSFETIEGNTSLTNQSNGGEVMRRKRNIFKGVLFVHPKVLD